MQARIRLRTKMLKYNPKTFSPADLTSLLITQSTKYRNGESLHGESKNYGTVPPALSKQTSRKVPFRARRYGDHRRFGLIISHRRASSSADEGLRTKMSKHSAYELACLRTGRRRVEERVKNLAGHQGSTSTPKGQPRLRVNQIRLPSPVRECQILVCFSVIIRFCRGGA